jgi:hypothetical protein
MLSISLKCIKDHELISIKCIKDIFAFGENIYDADAL